MNTRRTLFAVVIMGAFVAGIGLTAGATTYGLFSDSARGSGSIQAATSFDVPGDGACVDTDGNGQCNPGDVPIDKDNLSTFDNESADLVIPESTGDIETGNKNDISITARSIMSEVDLGTKNADVELNAGTGGIVLNGSKIVVKGGNGEVDINSAGPVSLSDARITTNNQPISITSDAMLNLDGATINTKKEITIRAAEISARNAVFTSKTRDIILHATRNGGGRLDATGATIKIKDGNGQISLASIGNVSLKEGMLITSNTRATVDLGREDSILSINGLSISGQTPVLTYAPRNITLDRSQDTGTVKPE